MTTTNRIAFSDRFLEKLKPDPTGKPTHYWDRVCPNLGVRVSGVTGAATFYMVRRVKDQTAATWFKLGRYPIITLADARDRALGLLRLITEGLDPRQVAAQQKRVEEQAAREAEAKAITFGTVAEKYIQHLEAYGERKGLRSTDRNIARIRRSCADLYSVPVIDITTQRVVELNDQIIERGRALVNGRHIGGPHSAKFTLVELNRLCKWAVLRGHMHLNPFDKIEKLSDLHGVSMKDTQRNRWLEDWELRLVWAAASQMTYPFRDLVKLLLLTGCRLRELGNASWTEVDWDKAELVIPAHRYKTKRDHVVPLSSLAMQIVAGLPRFTHGDFMFTARDGREPIRGYYHSKQKLDGLLGDEVAEWKLHDLRRTCRTGLTSVHVAKDVAEAVLGHTVKGVEGIYNRYDYYDEKRAGLEAWAHKVMAIVEPPPHDNVIKMRAAG